MTDTDPLTKLRNHDRCLNGIMLSATFVVGIVVYFCLFRPLEIELQDVRSLTTNLQCLVEQTSAISRQNHELRDLLVKSEQENSDLLQRIPTAPRESDFLTQICQLADRMHLEVLDYHPGAVHTQENHQEMEVKLSTCGEYEALCRFLQQVDHLPRLCRLTQMEIGTAADKTRLSSEMSFRIYFAPPAAVNTAPKKVDRNG